MFAYKNEFEEITKKGAEYLDEFEAAVKDPQNAQLRFLKELLKDNENTEYGKKYQFDQITSLDDFKRLVPVTEYSDYEEYIYRMIDNGETNLICAYPIIHYATSSGSTGKPKRIPASIKNIELFSAYGGNAIMSQLSKEIEKQNKSVGPICILADLSWENMKEGVTLGSISSHITYNYAEMANKLVTSPLMLQRPGETILDAVFLKALFALLSPDLSMIYATFSSAVYDFIHFIELNWENLVETIRSGKLSDELRISETVREEISKYLVANKERADFLEKEFSKGFDNPIVPRIWPNLAMFVCIGGSFFADYTYRLRKHSGNIPMHMNAYGASESMMAIPRDLNIPEYTPLVNKVFFEFLEVGKEDFSQTLLIDELEDGKEYEIIITNMSGFYRYRMFDVIHIEGHKDGMPYGHIVYRLNQVISIVGEKTNTEQLEYVVKKIAEHINTNIPEYSLYADYSNTPSRYILFLEPENNLGKGNQIELSDFTDKLFRQINVSFEKYRHQDTLAAPMVYFVEPSTFLLYKEMQIAKGISANQIKPVRIIDNEDKERFFFGLSEGPFKAMKRILFDVKSKLERIRELEIENNVLKKRIEQLEEELKNGK